MEKKKRKSPKIPEDLIALIAFITKDTSVKTTVAVDFSNIQ